MKRRGFRRHSKFASGRERKWPATQAAAGSTSDLVSLDQYRRLSQPTRSWRAYLVFFRNGVTFPILGCVRGFARLRAI